MPTFMAVSYPALRGSFFAKAQRARKKLKTQGKPSTVCALFFSAQKAVGNRPEVDYFYHMDKISRETRSRNMANIKGKNTKPEKLVRSVLHGMGFRFRLHVKKLPGSPDIVLPRYKSLIFVHGCFWHGHEGCKRATIPTTRADFWRTKISSNKERDAQNLADLAKLGYRCLIIWQCEMKDTAILKQRLSTFLHDTASLS
ncbi:very short patch repair endonuclease [Candidatus Desulfovibrio trichonymphae]|nr:very short patch repair endonuclease [Candidatus Desulfovibrio trichonymphae]